MHSGLKMALMALTLLSASVLADDVKFRNMKLLTISHKTYLQGTGLNVSGRDLRNLVIDVDILKADQVVGRRSIEVPSVGADEAWRIWLPIEIEGSDGFRVRSIVSEGVASGDAPADGEGTAEH